MRSALFAVPLEQRYEIPKSRRIWGPWITLQLVIFGVVFVVAYLGALHLEAKP